MNDLLTKMSIDMGINRYENETNESFVYRLCYSALGQWCLYTAKNTSGGVEGTTKRNQTTVLNDLIERFTDLFPYLSEKFTNFNHPQTSFSVNIRRLYEETGYLLGDSNSNKIANFGRTVRIGDRMLFFGIPSTKFEVCGLGVFASPTDYLVDLKDYMIRDNLTSEEYFESQFDPIDFNNRDIMLSDLEFFNPKSNKVPSKSWNDKLETDCTVARKSESGPYYRIMKIDNVFQFAEEPIDQQASSFTACDFRRLYFALKAHYGRPLKATFTKLDEIYSKIRLEGFLPNREYYLLLLLSWPEHNAFDKVNFIIRNEFLMDVVDVFKNIGIEIIGEQRYA